ncbi:MAG: L-serine ammonia-lyase, iron-sulfur-dependent, subunit alpha, partial [Oscillospiraceae bacterium]|nr:L-serine ammonia-lyase, iron-sulfur-dependent, subunit alpha [Oscillospiraceae bacterium]
MAAALPIRHSGACFRRRGHGLRPDRRQPHKRRAHREKRRSAAQQALFRGGGPAAREPQEPDGRGHYRLCRRVDLDDVRAPIARQIEYNTAIAEAGLTGQYGAAIGKILLDSYGDSVQNRAKAWAAAGSDARMNGCEKPVVINSGSGNQG